MRFECGPGPCFMREGWPRIALFDKYFTGKAGLSDADGILEAGGHLLIFEHKKPGAFLTTGQRLMFENATAVPNSQVWPCVIWSNIEFTGPIQWVRYLNGHQTKLRESTLEEVGRVFGLWQRMAKAGNRAGMTRLWKEGW